MIHELCDLLRREADAVAVLAGRMRALELVMAADERRFVPLALEEVEAAAERLAALELTRVLVLSTAGLPADLAATGLVDRVADPDLRARVREAIGELVRATGRLADGLGPLVRR